MNKEHLIENYFLDKLSLQEQEAFNNLLEHDPEFKAQVAFESKVRKSIFVQKHQDLKSQLKSVEENLPKKRSNNSYWIAASVVLLLSLGFYWMFRPLSTEQLFADYYQPAANTTHPIVRDHNTQESQISQAFIAYESQDYKVAQELFSSVYSATQESELLLYQGISCLELNNTQEAIRVLLSHKHMNDSLVHKTEWYLALAYLKSGETEKAKAQLKEVINHPQGYNIHQAKELLAKL